MAQAIIGLGNPGPEYRDTRHNVGQRVLDKVARRVHARFSREGGHQIARAQWQGEALVLIKPACFMNVSGPAVARVSRRLHLEPSDLVIVFDDLDLPLGKVRARMKGSAGGHHGVRSVIESLGTQEIRRVKVGIGRPERKDDVPDHVLTAFDEDELPVVDAAVAEAAERVLALLA